MKKQKWTTENIPDLSGKTAVVTGANSGIGFETARVLASKGARVVLTARSSEKGEGAVDEIMQQDPDANVSWMELDLSDLASVKQFAKDFPSTNDALDILVNNAGVMAPPYSKTKDGFELQLGTNHFGHFALTGLLMPLLQKSDEARVVTVSSMAHHRGNLDFDDLNWEKRDYSPMAAYSDSKIANLYFTYELARKLEGTNVIAVAAHPGWTQTNLQKHNKFFSYMNPFVSQKPDMGALPSLRAATDEHVQNGDYYGPDGKAEIKGHPIRVISNELSHSESIAKKLWQISEDATGVAYSL